MEILSQRDPRWSGIELDSSGWTIGQDGCAITSIAMLAGCTPIDVNNLNDYVNYGDIVWSQAASDLGLPYGNPTRPCVAQTLIDGQYMHFFVLNADGSILDPWTGQQQPEGYYNIVNIINIGLKQGVEPMALYDRTGYLLGVSKKTFAHLSNQAEADANGISLSPNNMDVLYGNNFIQIKGRPEIYQWITSEEAMRIITEGGETPNINIVETDVDTVKILQTQIADLTKQLADAKAQPLADTTAKNTNAKVNWLVQLFKDIFHR